VGPPDWLLTAGTTRRWRLGAGQKKAPRRPVSETQKDPTVIRPVFDLGVKLARSFAFGSVRGFRSHSVRGFRSHSVRGFRSHSVRRSRFALLLARSFAVGVTVSFGFDVPIAPRAAGRRFAFASILWSR